MRLIRARDVKEPTLRSTIDRINRALDLRFYVKSAPLTQPLDGVGGKTMRVRMYRNQSPDPTATIEIALRARGGARFVRRSKGRSRGGPSRGYRAFIRKILLNHVAQRVIDHKTQIAA